MPKWKVVLAHPDGQITEKEVSVLWDAEKVGADEVAKAVASMTMCEGGHNQDGSFKHPCEGVSAILLPAEPELVI